MKIKKDQPVIYVHTHAYTLCNPFLLCLTIDRFIIIIIVQFNAIIACHLNGCCVGMDFVVCTRVYSIEN